MKVRETGPTLLQYGLDRLAQMATDELPIAPKPQWGGDQEVAHLMPHLRVPLDDIVSFAAEQHRADPQDLASLVLHFTTESELDLSGGVPTEPGILMGKLCFPIVKLALRQNPKTGQINTNKLNAVLRHELRHIFQKKREALYERPRVVQTVQAIGGLTSIAWTTGMQLSLQQGPPNFPEILFGVGAAASAAFAAPSLAEWVANVVDKDELDANSFARRHRHFRPITLA